MARIVLVGGPAGAGKTTLARRWCAGRARATHVELDAVRELIVGGLADPQEPGRLADEQYGLAVAAALALAREFAAAGYDVAVDDVLEPDVFEREWRPRLDGLDWTLVVVLPSLAETLARSAGRTKRVRDEHVREQHGRCSAWPAEYRIDTTGLSVEQSAELFGGRLG